MEWAITFLIAAVTIATLFILGLYILFRDSEHSLRLFGCLMLADTLVSAATLVLVAFAAISERLRDPIEIVSALTAAVTAAACLYTVLFRIQHGGPRASSANSTEKRDRAQ